MDKRLRNGSDQCQVRQEDNGGYEWKVPGDSEHSNWPDHQKPGQDREEEVRDLDHCSHAPERDIRPDGQEQRQEHPGLRVAQTGEVLLQAGDREDDHWHHGRELHLSERVPGLPGETGHYPSY